MGETLLSGAFGTGSGFSQNCELRFIFLKQRTHLYAIPSPFEQNISMYSSVRIAYFHLTIYLGDFSKSVQREDPHFYSTETNYSTELVSYDLTSPPLRGI